MHLDLYLAFCGMSQLVLIPRPSAKNDNQYVLFHMLRLHITKTRLFKYTENFTTKN